MNPPTRGAESIRLSKLVEYGVSTPWPDPTTLPAIHAAICGGLFDPVDIGPDAIQARMASLAKLRAYGKAAHANAKFVKA